jgi:hypothetical protein
MLSTVAPVRDNALSPFPGELRHSLVALPTIPVHRMADASSSADVGARLGPESVTRSVLTDLVSVLSERQLDVMTRPIGAGGGMAQPVRVGRPTEQEEQKLKRIVSRGSTSVVRYRRATMLPASAGGNTVPAIARLVQANEDTVRELIHTFNEIG